MNSEVWRNVPWKVAKINVLLEIIFNERGMRKSGLTNYFYYFSILYDFTSFSIWGRAHCKLPYILKYIGIVQCGLDENFKNYFNS